jgi:hypothetical protein
MHCMHARQPEGWGWGSTQSASASGGADPSLLLLPYGPCGSAACTAASSGPATSHAHARDSPVVNVLVVKRRRVVLQQRRSQAEDSECPSAAVCMHTSQLQHGSMRSCCHQHITCACMRSLRALLPASAHLCECNPAVKELAHNLQRRRARSWCKTGFVDALFL